MTDTTLGTLCWSMHGKMRMLASSSNGSKRPASPLREVRMHLSRCGAGAYPTKHFIPLQFYSVCVSADEVSFWMPHNLKPLLSGRLFVSRGGGTARYCQGVESINSKSSTL